VVKIRSPILKGLSSKKREDFSASLQQDLPARVQKKYLISVGLTLKEHAHAKNFKSLSS